MKTNKQSPKQTPKKRKISQTGKSSHALRELSEAELEGIAGGVSADVSLSSVLEKKAGKKAAVAALALPDLDDLLP